MVQPRNLLAWAIIVAVISLNFYNCNAAIATIGEQRPRGRERQEIRKRRYDVYFMYYQ